MLFHRKRSKQWQARIKRFSGKWFDVSTGREDLEEAKAVAGHKYDVMLQNRAQGTVEVSRQFRDIARFTAKRLQAEIDAGTGRSVYRDYIQAINNYLIPCFTSTAVHNIDEKQLLRLDKFRRDKLNRDPNKSTVSTHNAALALVFQDAVERNYMLATQVPTLGNSGRKGQARPYFSKDEISPLLAALEGFSTTGLKPETVMNRELLRDYVVILLNTGMRAGTEPLTMKWLNIRQITLPDTTNIGLEFSVDGKTGKRTLIAQDADGVVSAGLKRLQDRFPMLAKLSRDELFKQDAYVFRLRSGKRVTNDRLAKHFKRCLQKYSLLTNSQAEQRTLYSLRHSYATFQILNGVDMATLAVQMGTSIGMLERHYSKLKPYMKLATLNGAEKSSQSGTTHLEQLVLEHGAMIRQLLEAVQQLSNKK